jgi:hypothetical protein
MFLDDAQEKYWDIRFWEQLLKVSCNWLPSNFRVVISSTHLLSVSSSSPASFECLPKIERGDFLLTPNESKQFLELPVIGLPQKFKSENLKQLIISHCGGLIGALRLSIDSLNISDMFYTLQHYGINDMELSVDLYNILSNKMTTSQNVLKLFIKTMRDNIQSVSTPSDNYFIKDLSFLEKF